MEEKERTEKGRKKKKRRRRRRRRRKKVDTKLPTETERARERKNHLCETKCFCNCVGDLVVWHINKVFDFSIFLLLCTSKVSLRCVGMKIRNFFFPFIC